MSFSITLNTQKIISECVNKNHIFYWCKYLYSYPASILAFFFAFLVVGGPVFSANITSEVAFSTNENTV